MGIMQAMFKQFRKPTGWLGKIAGLGMNREHEKVWRWGLEHVAIAPDATILDVGCGGGGAVKILAQAASRGKVYGVDYSEDVLLTARRVNQALIEQGRVELKRPGGGLRDHHLLAQPGGRPARSAARAESGWHAFDRQRGVRGRAV